jgi:hypothetical protein
VVPTPFWVLVDPTVLALSYPQLQEWSGRVRTRGRKLVVADRYARERRFRRDRCCVEGEDRAAKNRSAAALDSALEDAPTPQRRASLAPIPS